MIHLGKMDIVNIHAKMPIAPLSDGFYQSNVPACDTAWYGRCKIMCGQEWKIKDSSWLSIEDACDPCISSITSEGLCTFRSVSFEKILSKVHDLIRMNKSCSDYNYFLNALHKNILMVM